MRVMLMLSDREEISRGLAEGLEYKEIGLGLGRDSSVISREVGRHGGRGGYRAVAADTAACAARERPKLFDYKTPDGYQFYLNIGPLANVDRMHFKGKIEFWNDLMEHGTYDEFWKSRNIRPHLKNIKAAVMTVGWVSHGSGAAGFSNRSTRSARPSPSRRPDAKGRAALPMRAIRTSADARFSATSELCCAACSSAADSDASLHARSKDLPHGISSSAARLTRITERLKLS